MTHERKHSCARGSWEQDHCETSIPPSRLWRKLSIQTCGGAPGRFRTGCRVNSGSISAGLLTTLLPMKCECPSREVVEDASAGGRAYGILHTLFLLFSCQEEDPHQLYLAKSLRLSCLFGWSCGMISSGEIGKIASSCSRSNAHCFCPGTCRCLFWCQC